MYITKELIEESIKGLVDKKENSSIKYTMSLIEAYTEQTADMKLLEDLSDLRGTNESDSTVIGRINDKSDEIFLKQKNRGASAADFDDKTIRVVMKDPDSLYEAVRDKVDRELVGSPEDEAEAARDLRIEKYQEVASKWFEYGEYLTVEFNTETGTIKVVPVSEQ